MSTLILLRHGQSEWNASNRFTGWFDCGLTDVGIQEAKSAGNQLVAAGITPDVVHTSLLLRAIDTADLVLQTMNLSSIPVRRSWRLNERHYGNLTGMNKVEAKEKFGEKQLHDWRRGFDTPPPPIDETNLYDPVNDSQYKDLTEIPKSECLADVVKRLIPWWADVAVPDLRMERTVLIAAHGNSLRALCKLLDDISDSEITNLNLPTGTPIIYELDNNLRPLETIPVLDRTLNPKIAQEAAEAVAKQAR